MALPGLAELKAQLVAADEAGDYEKAATIAKQIRARNSWERGAGRTELQSALTDKIPTGQLALEGLGGKMKNLVTLGLGERASPEADKALSSTLAGGLGGLAPDLLAGIPLARGAQALQRIMPWAQKAPLTASYLTNAGLAGSYAGLTTPGSIGERAKDAGSAALFSGLGEAGARGLGYIARGPLAPSKMTADARAMYDQGVPVPLWKARDNGVIRDMAERAKGYVIARSVINNGDQAALEAWNRNLSKAATPPTPIADEAGNILRWKPGSQDAVTDLGSEGLRKLRGRFDDAYDALYKGRTLPVDKQFGDEIAATMEATKRYYPHTYDEVQGVKNRIDDIFAATRTKPGAQTPILAPDGSATALPAQLGHEGVTPGAVKEALNVLDDSINNAWRAGNAEKAESLGSLRDSLLDMRHRGLPPEVQAASGDINSAYRNYKQLERATSLKSAQKAGLVTPDQMLGAARALDRTPGKSAFAKGAVTNQQDYLRAERVLGSRLPEVGPGTFEKYALSGLFTSPLVLGADLGATSLAALATSPVGQRALLGQYGVQPKIQRLFNNAAPYAAQESGVLAP